MIRPTQESVRARDRDRRRPPSRLDELLGLAALAFVVLYVGYFAFSHFFG
jgi:hypothetical protein